MLMYSIVVTALCLIYWCVTALPVGFKNGLGTADICGNLTQVPYIIGMIAAGSAPIKKPLALEMQNNDLMALTTALNQIFRQDEEFRQVQNKNENEYRDLITNISHDLRTPLTVLKGYLQLLERCEIDDTGKKYLSFCFLHTDELEQRTRQFFEYSYLINQEQEPQLKILNVTNLIVAIMADFIPMFEGKGLTMRLGHVTIYKGLAEEVFAMRDENLLRIGFYLRSSLDNIL